MALLYADHKIKISVLLLKKTKPKPKWNQNPTKTKSKPKHKPQRQNAQKKTSFSAKEQIEQKSSLLLTAIHYRSSLFPSATEKHVDLQLKI